MNFEFFNFIIYFLLIITLGVLMRIYFGFAIRFNIVDLPNKRSSHSTVTIRGGGIIGLISVILWEVLAHRYPYFFIGFIILGVLSFLDDIKSLSVTSRLPFQFVCCGLLFYEVSKFNEPWWYLFFILIFSVGIINGFNFMDGINGMTGLYVLITLASLSYVNHFQLVFTDEFLLGFSIVSVLIFLYFNFRKRAKCFAGDVGAIVWSFLSIFLLYQLINSTQFFGWILFLCIYGFDVVFTLLIRIKKRENIFNAHRSHLYQYMVNEMGKSHLVVSSLYSGAQLIINFIVILSYFYFPGQNFIYLLMPLMFLFGYWYLRYNVIVNKE